MVRETSLHIIDSHTHVIASDTDKYPFAPVGGHQSDWSKARPVDHHGLVAAMDAAGIAQAMVVQASTVYGHDARYVVEAIKSHPTRFVGVFSIDAMADDAVEQMKRWLGEGPGRDAPVHHRHHHAGPGPLAGRPQVLSGLGVCRGERRLGLPADDQWTASPCCGRFWSVFPR